MLLRFVDEMMMMKCHHVINVLLERCCLYYKMGNSKIKFATSNLMCRSLCCYCIFLIIYSVMKEGCLIREGEEAAFNINASQGSFCDSLAQSWRLPHFNS